MRRFLMFLFYAFLLIFCTACRSSKQIVEKHEKAQVNIRDSCVLHLQQELTESHDFTRNMEMDEGWTMDFTVYQPPDSNGVQHVRATGKITKDKKSKDTQIIHHNKDETRKAQMKRESEITEDTVTDETSEDSKSSPFIYLRIFFAVTIFIFIYKLVKKWLR